MRIEDRFQRALQAAGYRRTDARRAVIRAVIGAPAHFTAEDVFSRAASFHEGLGRATVYRTMELLADLGLLRAVSLDDAAQHYFVVDGGHHHFICTRCRESLEFEHCGLGATGSDMSKEHGFELHGHLLELYGICADCLASEATARGLDVRRRDG